MIPADIDLISTLADLNAWGIRDYKIEAMCGLSEGRIAKIKCGATKSMIYANAARLYNLWFDEAIARGVTVPCETSSFQAVVETTT